MKTEEKKTTSNSIRKQLQRNFVIRQQQPMIYLHVPICMYKAGYLHTPTTSLDDPILDQRCSCTNK